MNEIVNDNVKNNESEEQGEDDQSDKIIKINSQFDILPIITLNNNLRDIIENDKLNIFSKWNKNYIYYFLDKNLENYKTISLEFNQELNKNNNEISDIYYLNKMFYFFQIGNYQKVLDIYLSYINDFFEKNNSNSKVRYYFIFNINALLCLIETGLLLNQNEFSKKIIQKLDSLINENLNLNSLESEITFDPIIINYLNEMEIYNQNINFPEIIRLYRSYINLNEGYIQKAKKNLDDYKSMYNFSNKTKGNYPLFIRMKKIYNMLKIRYDYLNKPTFKCFKHLNSLIMKFPNDNYIKIYYYNTYGILNLKNKNINLAKHYFNQCNKFLKEGSYGFKLRFGFMIKYNIALCNFYEKKYDKCLNILFQIQKIEIFLNNPFIYFRIGLCFIEILLNKINSEQKNKKLFSLIDNNNDYNIFYINQNFFETKNLKVELEEPIKMFYKVINLCDNIIKNNKINLNNNKFNKIEKALNFGDNNELKNKNTFNSQNLHYESYNEIFILSYLNLLFCFSLTNSFNEIIFIVKYLFIHQIKNIIQNNKTFYYTIENYLIFAYLNTNQIELAKNELYKINKKSISDLEGIFISNHKLISKEVYFKINLIMNSILINLKNKNYEEVLLGIKSGLKIYYDKSIKNIPHYFNNLILFYLLETGQKELALQLIKYKKIPEYFYK